MSFSFQFSSGPWESIPSAIAAVLLVMCLFFLAIGVVMYVFHAIGLFTIAKRRQIKNYWLAWIPVGDAWILGNIADQYDYVSKGKYKKSRFLLLWLDAAMLLAAVGLVIYIFGNLIPTLTYASEAYIAQVFLGYLICVILVMAVEVTAMVFLYIAYYKLYQSCDPDRAVLFIVLSVIISVTLPFFVFAIRKKDLGMYPRPQPMGGPCGPGTNPLQADPRLGPQEPIYGGSQAPRPEPGSGPQDFE